MNTTVGGFIAFAFAQLAEIHSTWILIVAIGGVLAIVATTGNGGIGAFFVCAHIGGAFVLVIASTAVDATIFDGDVYTGASIHALVCGTLVLIVALRVVGAAAAVRDALIDADVVFAFVVCALVLIIAFAAVGAAVRDGIRRAFIVFARGLDAGIGRSAVVIFCAAIVDWAVDAAGRWVTGVGCACVVVVAINGCTERRTFSFAATACLQAPIPGITRGAIGDGAFFTFARLCVAHHGFARTQIACLPGATRVVHTRGDWSGDQVIGVVRIAAGIGVHWGAISVATTTAKNGQRRANEQEKK